MFANFKSLLDGTFISNSKAETCIEHRQPPKPIKFLMNEERTVLRGNCLNHLENYIIYNGMDTETGQLFAIKEWIVYDIDSQQKEKILEHLSLLVHLRHPSLAKLENFTYEHVAAENKWIFYILQEFIFGANCLSLFLIKNNSMPIDVLRHTANGILNAFDFLCKNGITCPNIMDTYIFINDNGDIKLLNYEINDYFTSSTSVPMQLEFYNTNMYNFGILLLSLMRGEIVKPDLAEIPQDPFIVRDFLVRCVTNSDITELLNHSFIQASSDFISFDEVAENSQILHKPEVLERPQSRIELDFEILELLGRGHFGKVYKAKKKLDGRIYALKKIKLNTKNDKLNSKLIREVQFLSGLNHDSIVRYYNSWTDVENTTNSDKDTDSSDLEGSRDLEYDTDDNPSMEDKMEYSDRMMLYIQMEYYEGKTLHDVIEGNDLHWDISRISKYLRELVEGLAHIHEQGIVHRDLKPLNIFLDSNDHVKIGDFGLATTNVRYRVMLSNNIQNDKDAIAPNIVDIGSSTSQVGTVLYKAPELALNVRYCNHKLDMYSLGIILFEMCYERPNTGSERIAVLNKLRLKKIVFPKTFNHTLHSERRKIIRKLLNHNPLKRPTADELLENKCIPLILEEKKQQQMVKYIIDNPHLKHYKYLTEVFFHQTNLTYDYSSSMFEYKNISKLNHITNIITGIFKLHGGQNLRMSAVMPQSSCNNDCLKCVKLMTRTGSLVSIPCNNRIPFARYVAMNKDLTWLRRFSVEKTITPLTLQQEMYECVFDIITPISLQNVLLDAEILKIINEIKDSFQDLRPTSFCINLNHSLLIKAMFLECGFQDSCIDNSQEDAISKLVTLTEISCLVTHSTEILKLFENFEASNMANIALENLNKIVETAEKLGVKCPIKIKLGLMNNFEHHSGMLVELDYCPRKNRHVLATGGRYDKIIQKLGSSTSMSANDQVFKYGVGISVNLENLCDLLQQKRSGKNFDVVVCSFGEKISLQHEEIKILRELWSARFSCSVINVATIEHLKSWCKKTNVLWAILLNIDDIDRGIVTLIKLRHGNMGEEIKINIREVVDVLKHLRRKKSNKMLTQPLLVNKSTAEEEGLRLRPQS